ncbi:MAG: hypothetical protein LBH75_05535 [Treponema sp.]|jgi:histidinol dehydrogenase|nr:hypothetical protein [Treponema sp.]
MNVSPIQDHRTRERGLIVYPVYSRRSKGLSLGVNLFPSHKLCSFDCPYCEVFPFQTDFSFDIELMESALIETIGTASEVKDLCFSGNGEPTLSPHFKSALNRACLICRDHAPSAQVVVITNGTGLLKQDIFDFLIAKTHEERFNLWLKVDAGAGEWFRTIDRPKADVSFPALMEKMQAFTAGAGRNAVTIQTMLCRVNHAVPDQREAAAWEQAVLGLAGAGSVRNVHIYGKARPGPQDPLAQALPVSFLEERADSLRRAFKRAGFDIPIETFA